LFRNQSLEVRRSPREIEREAADAVRRERAELRERQRLELQDSQYQTAQVAAEGFAGAIALTTALVRRLTTGLAAHQEAVRAGAPDTFVFPKAAQVDQLAYRFRALASAMEAFNAQLYMSLQPFPLNPEQLARIEAEGPQPVELDAQLQSDWLEFRSLKALGREGLPVPDFGDEP
jgi:hypothetical protein